MRWKISEVIVLNMETGLEKLVGKGYRQRKEPDNVWLSKKITKVKLMTKKCYRKCCGRQ